jgi:hypothetical protein
MRISFEWLDVGHGETIKGHKGRASKQEQSIQHSLTVNAGPSRFLGSDRSRGCRIIAEWLTDRQELVQHRQSTHAANPAQNECQAVRQQYR